MSANNSAYGYICLRYKSHETFIYLHQLNDCLCLSVSFLFQWYDPEADCWVYSGNLFDLPFKRLRYCAATMQTDNRIYIFGGQALDDTSDEVYTILDTVNWYQVLDRTQDTSRLSRKNVTTSAHATGMWVVGCRSVVRRPVGMKQKTKTKTTPSSAAPPAAKSRHLLRSPYSPVFSGGPRRPAYAQQSCLVRPPGRKLCDHPSDWRRLHSPTWLPWEISTTSFIAEPVLEHH